MRKAILTIIMAVVCILSAYAVPSGVYVNRRDKPKVHINGSTISFFDTKGNVILRGTIVSENADHTFSIQYETGITESRNAWFIDEKGNTCLNVYGHPETLVKK